MTDMIFTLPKTQMDARQEKVGFGHLCSRGRDPCLKQIGNKIPIMLTQTGGATSPSS